MDIVDVIWTFLYQDVKYCEAWYFDNGDQECDSAEADVSCQDA